MIAITERTLKSMQGEESDVDGKWNYIVDVCATERDATQEQM